MKAFVLAGGLGTRLRARFGDLPKPLTPLGGRPFLERQIAWLTAHDVTEVVLCVGHGADQVERVLGDGSALGARLSYSSETEPLGTGGALALARGFVDGPALVLNGDTLPEIDPRELERTRAGQGATGALALYRLEDASASGRVEFDDGRHVTRFVEKDPGARGPAWVSGGCYAFASSLWAHLPEGPSSLEHDVLPDLAARGELIAHPASGTFYDIGTPEGWERAEQRWAS